MSKPSDLDIHEAVTITWTSVLCSHTFNRSALHETHTKKRANGIEPGSGFGTPPLVFHNLGHLMVFESVWGNATAALGKQTKDESEREGKSRGRYH